MHTSFKVIIAFAPMFLLPLLMTFVSINTPRCQYTTFAYCHEHVLNDLIQGNGAIVDRFAAGLRSIPPVLLIVVWPPLLFLSIPLMIAEAVFLACCLLPNLMFSAALFQYT